MKNKDIVGLNFLITLTKKKVKGRIYFAIHIPHKVAQFLGISEEDEFVIGEVREDGFLIRKVR